MPLITQDHILLTDGTVEVQAKQGEHPRVTIVAYNGGLMRIPGWGPLVIDLSGLDVSASQIGILADHDSTLKGIVGHGEAQIADGKLIVAGSIVPDSDAARRIIALARSGFRFQASVGVLPEGDTVHVRAGASIEINGRSVTAPGMGMTLVKRSVLREVSIVAIGADASTSVAIAATGERTAEEIRAEALSETERIVGIRRVCNGRHDEIEAEAIRDGWDVRQTELHVLRASRPWIGSARSRSAAPKEVIEAAVLVHMGQDELAAKELGDRTAQMARDLRCTSLLDLCRASLEAEGRHVPHGRTEMIRAALSTYSLPVALGDAANKVLLEAYLESPATWRSFAAIRSAADFKEHTGVRPSYVADLKLVPPGGEIEHGTLGESTYKFSIDTFARMMTIDRRDIVNDDLSLFDDTARSLGRSAMRSLSDLIYTVLLANDGSFFGAGNGNYDDGAGTELTSAALATGLARMLSQRDEENRDLDIRARTLLVPPELQQTAKELLQSDFIQRASDDLPTGNALKNAVRLEVEPRLSNAERFAGTSALAWYLFGSPADAALIAAFLQGKKNPTVEFFGFDADPNKLAASWRVFFDYGCSLGDFRAAYKAAGE